MEYEEKFSDILPLLWDYAKLYKQTSHKRQSVALSPPENHIDFTSNINWFDIHQPIRDTTCG